MKHTKKEQFQNAVTHAINQYLDVRLAKSQTTEVTNREIEALFSGIGIGYLLDTYDLPLDERNDILVEMLTILKKKLNQKYG
jgi:hypothetical protein